MSGVAWETGLLAGLLDAGVDVLTDTYWLGTSSGALVSAAFVGGTSPDELYERQLGPGSTAMRDTMQVDIAQLDRLLHEAVGDAADGTEMRRRMGGVACAEQPVSVDELRGLIAAELPTTRWPAEPIGLVAVDTASGEPRVLDRTAGAPLVDAVAASCAIPGIWPAVPVAGSRYMDAGTRSNENLDLLGDADRVLVVSPCGTRAPSLWKGVTLRSAVRTVRERGAEVLVVEPDLDTGDHIRSHLLDPTAGAVAARAGRAQAAEVRDAVAALLG